MVAGQTPAGALAMPAGVQQQQPVLQSILSLQRGVLPLLLPLLQQQLVVGVRCSREVQRRGRSSSRNSSSGGSSSSREGVVGEGRRLCTRTGRGTSRIQITPAGWTGRHMALRLGFVLPSLASTVVLHVVQTIFADIMCLFEPCLAFT